MEKMVALPDKTLVPAIGQGTWLLGEQRGKRGKEAEAIKAGIETGMTLIDTAEMYGDGKSEELIGEVITGYVRNREKSVKGLLWG